MKLITTELLDEVSSQAVKSLRLRMNYNFHEELDAPIQRMLNALEPGTYLPPHRHLNPGKDEMYLILRGRLITFFFNDEGEVIDRVELSPLNGRLGIEIPAGVWHSMVVLEKGTVIYEIKQGPYTPISEDNVASWAPAPSDSQGIELFLQKLID